MFRQLAGARGLQETTDGRRKVGSLQAPSPPYWHVLSHVRQQAAARSSLPCPLLIHSPQTLLLPGNLNLYLYCRHVLVIDTAHDANV